LYTDIGTETEQIDAVNTLCSAQAEHICVAWRKSVGEFTRNRVEELVERAERKGVDWKAKTSGLAQDDERVLIAALATSLGIDAIQALDERLSLEELDERSRRMAEQAEAVEREMRDLA
jgi:hypothetical protein